MTCACLTIACKLEALPRQAETYADLLGVTDDAGRRSYLLGFLSSAIEEIAADAKRCPCRQPPQAGSPICIHCGNHPALPKSSLCHECRMVFRREAV